MPGIFYFILTGLCISGIVISISDGNFYNELFNLCLLWGMLICYNLGCEEIKKDVNKP